MVQEQHYDPFGLDLTVLNSQVGVTANRFKYLNRELQPDLGLYDLQARFYDPSIGRFTTVDPLTENQENLSPYHYGYDNPIRFSDPNGLEGSDCCGRIISYIAGVGSALRDNFGSVDGQSLYHDQVADAGLYNSGRELGHKASVVVSAIGIADGLLTAGSATAAAIASDGLLALPAAAAITQGLAQAAVSLNGGKNALSNLRNDKGRLNASSSDKSYTPKEGLPRDSRGNPVKDPQSSGPHTQLGTKKGSKGDYRQAREFNKKGEPVKDVDFTDHGRPQNHTNPHQHRYIPNETGGTPKRGPQEPLN